jgi:hypothetical protein
MTAWTRRARTTVEDRIVFGLLKKTMITANNH